MRTLLLSHVYSGDVLFTAALLVIIVATLDLTGQLAMRRVAPLARVTYIIALVLGALSGTPVRLRVLVPLLIALTSYGTSLLVDLENRFRRLLAVAVIALSAAAVLAELPHRMRAPAAPDPYSRLVVVGDSLASGGFGEKRRWIEILSERTSISIVDRSRASQDVAGAAGDVRQLVRTSGTAAMLLLIGGNDMLAGRACSEFANGLRELVRGSRSRGYHPIFLVELPVLPGRWCYAAQQRRISREHDLVLIPRRMLASVLSDPRNTSDGIHLTQRGHDRMAEALVPWLRGTGAFPPRR